MATPGTRRTRLTRQAYVNLHASSKKVRAKVSAADSPAGYDLTKGERRKLIASGIRRRTGAKGPQVKRRASKQVNALTRTMRRTPLGRKGDTA